MASHNFGYFTASTIGPFLTGKSDKLIAGGIQAAKEIAIERSGLVDLSQDINFSGSAFTEWGNLYEIEAIEAYEAAMMVTVADQQKGALNGWLACTPDGYVGADGLVEIKCPARCKNHWANLTRAAWLDDYRDQCQFQMLVTGRKWVDLVSFDPRFDEPLQLAIVRIEADPDWQARTLNRIEQAEAIIAEELNLIQSVQKRIEAGELTA